MKQFFMVGLFVVSSVYCFDTKVTFADQGIAENTASELDSIESEYNELKEQCAKLLTQREGAVEQLIFTYTRLVELRRKVASLEEQSELKGNTTKRGLKDLHREQEAERSRKKAQQQRKLLSNAQDYDSVDRLRRRQQKLLNDMERKIKSFDVALQRFRYVKERNPRSWLPSVFKE